MPDRNNLTDAHDTGELSTAPGSAAPDGSAAVSASNGSVIPASTPNQSVASATEISSGTPGSATGKGKVAVQIIEQDRSRPTVEFFGEPLEALDAALRFNVSSYRAPIMLLLDPRLRAVDGDCHHLDTPPPVAAVLATMSSAHPRPVWSWVTHGVGVRLIVLGSDAEDAEARAALAALSLGPEWSVEDKADTRHPRGRHPNRPGATCSEPVFEPADTTPVSFSKTAADPEAAKEWLATRGMVVGGRYNHELCLIDPAHKSEGKPVSVLKHGIYCFSCSGRAVSFRGIAKPGYVPFGRIVGRGAELSLVATMASKFVHWAHAKVVLKWHYPRAGDSVLRAAYRAALKSFVRGEGDTRDMRALLADLRVVRGHGVWLHVEALEQIKLTPRTLECMPWSCDAAKVETESDEETDDEKPKFAVVGVPPRIDLALSPFRLDGYVPIRTVRGAVLRPDLVAEDEAVALVHPSKGEPVELLRGRGLLPFDEAMGLLDKSFPGVQADYLMALLAGVVCAEGGGRPVLLQAVGPTGSGKGETVRLAAAALGDQVVKLVLDAESLEKWRRELGSALIGGRRILMVDEIGKVRRLGTYMRALLEISSEVSWRPLFMSADVLTPFRALIVLAHLSVPEVLASAPEYVRRVRLVRLMRRVPDWSATCGGDTAAWRSASPEHARILNSLLTHAVALAARNDYSWDRVADEIGLVHPDDGEAFLDEEALVRLYRYVCGRERARPVVTTGKFAPASGKPGTWIDLTDRGASDLLERLMPNDEEAHFHLRNRLESLAWNDLLKIPSPAIVCELRTHGKQVVCRFRAVERVMRGRERCNDRLPRDGRDDVSRSPFLDTEVATTDSHVDASGPTASGRTNGTHANGDLFAALAASPDAPAGGTST